MITVWIVCTTAHEAIEFKTEAQARDYMNVTPGAFHIYCMEKDA